MAEVTFKDLKDLKQVAEQMSLEQLKDLVDGATQALQDRLEGEAILTQDRHSQVERFMRDHKLFYQVRPMHGTFLVATWTTLHWNPDFSVEIQETAFTPAVFVKSNDSIRRYARLVQARAAAIISDAIQQFPGLLYTEAVAILRSVSRNVGPALASDWKGDLKTDSE